MKTRGHYSSNQLFFEKAKIRLNNKAIPKAQGVP